MTFVSKETLIILLNFYFCRSDRKRRLRMCAASLPNSGQGAGCRQVHRQGEGAIMLMEILFFCLSLSSVENLFFSVYSRWKEEN